MRHDGSGTSELEVPILETPRRFVRSSHEGVDVLFLVISNSVRPEIVAQRGIQKSHKQAPLVLVVENAHSSVLNCSKPPTSMIVFKRERSGSTRL